MFSHSSFTVLLKEEEECFDKSTFTCRAEEIPLDAVRVTVTTPDNTERLEEVAVDVQSRRKRLSKF